MDTLEGIILVNNAKNYIQGRETKANLGAQNKHRMWHPQV